MRAQVNMLKISICRQVCPVLLSIACWIRVSIRVPETRTRLQSFQGALSVRRMCSTFACFSACVRRFVTAGALLRHRRMKKWEEREKSRRNLPMTSNISFSHLWQQDDLSDVELVLTATAQQQEDAAQHRPDKVLRTLSAHCAILSNSPFLKVQVSPGERNVRIKSGSSSCHDN